MDRGHRTPPPKESCNVNVVQTSNAFENLNDSVHDEDDSSDNDDEDWYDHGGGGGGGEDPSTPNG